MAQGLLVFSQKTIQIGTIGISQEAQPALAVVWSFLLLGEVVNGWQVAGIAMVVCGLVAFVIAHQRGDRARRREKPSELAIKTGAAGAAE
jgi:drug/metabolite transporter (DMT)-like permease